MNAKQKLLARIRAWIDRRLPRDLMVVQFIDPATGDVEFSASHMDIILKIKMGEHVYKRFDKVMDIRFHIEHLSP